MDNFVEKLSPEPITSEEVITRMRLSEKRVDEVFKQHGTAVEAEKEIRNEFINSLKREAERFEHVVITERGSVYFEFKDGNSMRFKKSNERWLFEYEVTENIFYVTEQVVHELQSGTGDDPSVFTNSRNYLNRPIPVQKPEIGLIPFQFGFVRPYPKIECEVNENILTIKGDKDGNFTSGVHFGDKITEIIK